MLNTSMALPNGTRLQDGAYAIGKLLGQSDFGLTYYGGDMALKRYVVIKEFFPAGCERQGLSVEPGSVEPGAPLTSDGFQNARTQLLSEIQPLAQLEHHNVARIQKVFEENDTVYLVLEHVKGQTLAQLVQTHGALPEATVIDYARQLCDGLAALHNLGIIHRSLNPRSIVVGDDGRVVIADFTLVTLLEEAGSLPPTSPGATRAEAEIYWAPEEHEPSGQLGYFSDIYALGATVYHLLTGQVPPSALDRAAGQKLLPPHRLNPAVTLPVSEAVARAMALAPEQRPQDAYTFFRLLTRPPAPPAAQPATTPMVRPQGNTSPKGIDTSSRVVAFDPLAPQSPARPPAPLPDPIEPAAPQPNTWGIVPGEGGSTDRRQQNQTWNPADNSGQGQMSVLPDELKGFNWGAFVFNWIWSIPHSTWIGLLSLTPCVGFFMTIALGIKGNEWAWQNRKWDSIEHFKKVQRIWSYWALGFFLFYAFIILVGLLGGGSSSSGGSFD